MPGKSKAGTRTIPILSVLREFLEPRVSAAGDALVFGRPSADPFDPKTLGDRAKRAWSASNKHECEAAEREGPAASDHVARVPPHLRVVADRRRRQPEGDSGARRPRSRSPAGRLLT